MLELDSLIRARDTATTADAVQTRPAWMRPLGDQPGTDSEQAPWLAAVALVASYRDLNQITSTAPVGVDPGGDGTVRQRRRLATRAAATARGLSNRTNDNTPIQ
jgi:hypothetical protein